MASAKYCDGIKRRDFLKVGALGAIGTAGLTLADYLRFAKAGDTSQASAKSGIIVYLQGGPSHMDTFDMKPDSSTEFRGEFQPIDTNVPGIQISEHLPKMAQVADTYSIVRGVSHTLGAHNLGREYLTTGNRPIASLTYPGYGSVAAKELSGDPELPRSVAIPSALHPAGFLGVAYNPLSTGATPRPGRPFVVRGTSLGSGLEVADVEKRQQLLADLDTTFRELDDNELLRGLDEFSQQAHDMITSPKSRAAFDVSQEPPEVAERFGSTPLGMSCLMAVRLIEAGVRFVTVSTGGWDTHQNNFNSLRDTRLPQLDQALSAMFQTLRERGLLKETGVMVTGEFGRTPKINRNAGRDHWPRAMFVLLGGGGMKGGTVVGASDDRGMEPADNPISPDSVAATYYHSLGIDPTHEYHTPSGRPVMLVRNGQVVDELF